MTQPWGLFRKSGLQTSKSRINQVHLLVSGFFFFLSLFAFLQGAILCFFFFATSLFCLKRFQVPFDVGFACSSFVGFMVLQFPPTDPKTSMLIVKSKRPLRVCLCVTRLSGGWQKMSAYFPVNMNRGNDSQYVTCSSLLASTVCGYKSVICIHTYIPPVQAFEHATVWQNHCVG